MSGMFTPLKKYAVFSGRARRKEYWLFILFVGIGFIVFSVIGVELGIDRFTSTSHDGNYSVHMTIYTPGIFYLLMLIPIIAVSVRRLHDINFRGWWVLIYFIPIFGSIALLVLHCLEGTKGTNRFGEDPIVRDKTDSHDA